MNRRGLAAEVDLPNSASKNLKQTDDKADVERGRTKPLPDLT